MARSAAIAVISGANRRDDLAVRSHDRRRGHTYAAWTTGELENALPGLKAGCIEHRISDRGPSGVNVIGVLTPRRGD